MKEAGKIAENFYYAIKGIYYTINTQGNAKIQLFFALLVILAGIFFELALQEWLIIVFIIGFVLSLETFNTALEELVNFVSPEYHKQAGLVKDIAAGAVLIGAITALLIGNIIFLPKIYHWIFTII